MLSNQPQYYRQCALVLGLLGLIACSSDEERAPASLFAVKDFAKAGEVNAPCNYQNPYRDAYFGDLHVHTHISSDAYAFGTRATPSQAYAYAFGDAIELVADDEGLLRSAKLERPLDFMGVTDHAEMMGEQSLCLNPDFPLFDSEACEPYRFGDGRDPALAFRIMNPWSTRDGDICGDDDSTCREATAGIWESTIDAAQQWNDFSANCERTTFIAYEYSSHRMGANLHRNVIFRNASVPGQPVSYLDRHREWGLWDVLNRQCLESGTGCDAIAIPHNSNISNGRMFQIDYPETDSTEEQIQRAQLRVKVEPIVEIMQHKGDSECRNGLKGVLGGEDEYCDFEKFENLAFSQWDDNGEVGDCSTSDYRPHLGPDCLSRLSYTRYALIEGLKEQERIGVNPFKFGLMASTDTHNGTGGAVDEKSYPGHIGTGDNTLEKRATYSLGVPGNASNNPGGLIGVWATENSRDSLFDAMKRREVFGTSGPRIKPRLFAGWELDQNLCDDPEWLEKAYDNGVPMGSDLPVRSTSGSTEDVANAPETETAPAFLAMALADAGTAQNPGTPLQRIQIIKGWYDEEGNHHQRVFDIAGNFDQPAGVDLQSCEPTGHAGFKQLCSVWQDPEFNANQHAVYYSRVLENPVCRYDTYQCSQESDKPASCNDEGMPKTIQERAWTSPIWYTATNVSDG